MSENYLNILRQRLAGHRPAFIEGNYREAGVLMAITEPVGPASDFIPELILTRRASHLTLHPGEAAFPGGKKDPVDKDLLDTAIRESHEEINLAPQSVSYIGQLNQRLTRTDIKVSPFVATVAADTPLTANPNEIDAIYKVPLDFFMESVMGTGTLQWIEKEHKGVLKQVPHFYFQEHIIMGVTALMIVDLMHTVFDIDLRV